MIYKQSIIETGFILTILLIGIAFGSWIGINYEESKQPEIKPCNCISFREAISRKEKYDFYIDKLNNASKKDRPRWQDSVTRQTKLIQF